MKPKSNPVKNRSLPGNESVLRQLWHDPMGRAGMIGVCLVILMAVFAPWIAQYDVAKMNARAKLTGPSAQFWFGTDHFGRDVFSRIVYGARVSLAVPMA